MTNEDEALRSIAHELRDSLSTIAFTGAGISTESGIADFRSPGGIWSRYKPVLYQDFLASEEARQRYWAMKREGHAEFAGARPNIAHTILARLEETGKLRAVITQNIDGLHQDAGSQKVLELHGNGRIVLCLECDYRTTADEIFSSMKGDETGAPRCPDCGGILKPGTISFGQPLPAAVIAEAEELARSCELFLAIGSSLVVQPAALLPVIAREHKAHLVIVNRDETPLDPIAHEVIRTPIGEAMERIEEMLQV